MDSEKIKTAVSMILEAIGENPEREGLIGTPAEDRGHVRGDTLRIKINPKAYLETQFTEDKHG